MERPVLELRTLDVAANRYQMGVLAVLHGIQEVRPQRDHFVHADDDRQLIIAGKPSEGRT